MQNNFDIKLTKKAEKFIKKQDKDTQNLREILREQYESGNQEVAGSNLVTQTKWSESLEKLRLLFFCF